MRKITCWTLGRYAGFIAESDDLFPPVLQNLLERLLDNNKMVQRAACMALSRLFDHGGHRLEEYITPLLQTLLLALDRYQVRHHCCEYTRPACPMTWLFLCLKRKNYVILCEVVGTFVEMVGPVMEKPVSLAWHSLLACSTAECVWIPPVVPDWAVM